MREIKFRAWIVDEYAKDGNTPSKFKMVEWFSEMFSDFSPVTHYSDEFPDKDGDNVLMQFTGLADMAGNEIYEGDILASEDDLYLVKFIAGCFGSVDVESLPCDEPGIPFVALYDHDLTCFEIVGNMYENPGLLG